jgi:hypothetical protein
VAKPLDKTGLIVGTSVGGVVFAVILAVLVYFGYRWHKKRSRRRDLEDEFDLGGQGMYDPGYGRDHNRDMEEVDNLTPYPFTAPASYDSNYGQWDVGHGWDSRYEQAPLVGAGSVVPAPTVPHSASLPSFPSFPSSSTAPVVSAAGSHTSLPPQEGIRRTATTTAVAAAPSRESKLEAERRRTRSLQRPSGDAVRLRPTPAQAEDAGFVADGGEIPPVYQPEWEAAQRQRLGGHGVI